MAGQPKWNGFLAAVNDAGGEEIMLDHIRGGGTLKALGQRFGVGVDQVTKYFKRQGDKRHAAFLEAFKDSALARVEKADELLTEADHQALYGNSAAVTHAMNKSKLQQWLAAKADPHTFGERKEVNVQVGFGTQFLEVLRAKGRPREVIPVGEAYEIGAGAGLLAAGPDARDSQPVENAELVEPVDSLV
jgi:hypothetical protein